MGSLSINNKNLILSIKGEECLRVESPSLETDTSEIDRCLSWFETHDGILRCEGSRFLCDARVINIKKWFIQLSFSCYFTKEYSLRSIKIPLRLNAEQITFLNRFYQWQVLGSQELVDSLTPGYIIGKSGNNDIHLRIIQHGLLGILPTGQIDLYVDHSATHPRVLQRRDLPPRRDSYLTTSNRYLRCELVVWTPEKSNQTHYPVLWRYPGGKLACLTITDHADWDTTQKLRVLFTESPGFNTTHVRTTKSVFWATKGRETQEKTLHPDGLDEPAFRKVADQLYDAGHEICPHSIVVRAKANEKVVPYDLVLEALDGFSARYGCGTWIDHSNQSRQAINYSQFGWDKTSEWYLIELLRTHGFSNLWSFYDVFDHPINNLNHLAEQDKSLDLIKAAVNEASKGNSWRALNYIKLSIRLSTRDRGREDLDIITSIAKVLTSPLYQQQVKINILIRFLPHIPFIPFRLIYHMLRSNSMDFINSDTIYPTLYCETGLPIGQVHEDDLLLFATSAVNVYSTSIINNLDRLINERGIHFCHTYLCADLKYGEPAVIQQGKGWEISHTFSELLKQLDEMITTNQLWNPTMRDCTVWFKNWIQIRLDYLDPNNLIARNPTNHFMKDLSLQFPKDTRLVKINGNEISPARTSPLIYTFDLPPHSDAKLSWYP